MSVVIVIAVVVVAYFAFRNSNVKEKVRQVIERIKN